ncbi:MAG: hypothetical protein LiPW41_795 [Parcubacteria group bacterium LiPW_41]|nr:MAG: hypothetical protein LiPW41_795 [Parcubacteria group bacterium LiPW_41]
MERTDDNTPTTSQEEKKEVNNVHEEQEKSDFGTPEEWPIDARYMRVYM